MNPTPSHATIRIGKTVFEDLPVLHIDYTHKRVTVEFSGLGETQPYAANLSDVLLLTYPNCPNELV